MEKTYIIPIELKETGEKEENIFSRVAELKLHEKQITAKDITDLIEENLKEIAKNNVEISFVGEYFTKLDLDKQEELLSSILPYIKDGKISNITIETMPQYITRENLKVLKKYKFKNIKLNVATLNNYLLKRAGFPFTYEEIKKSSKLIKRMGFNLIYKIYIGLPDATKLDEINTAKFICKLKPKKVEIYPVEIKEKTKIEKEVQNGEYEQLTIIQSVERAKEIIYILTKKKIDVEIKDEEEECKFKKKVESGIWLDTIVDKIKKYNVKVKEVEIEVNSQNYESAVGFENENIDKLKEYYDVDSKVVKKEEIKPGKLEIIIKKQFTDFLEE